MSSVIDFVLHLDTHLATLISAWGVWIYLLLAIILFCETGLVITPFLPGDSLLFALGMVSAHSILNIHLAVIILIISVFCGDNTNYWSGRLIGKKLFKPNARILKTAYLDKSHAFFKQYGNKAILMARFIPIIRTFMPFTAGLSHMPYFNYMTISFVGSLIWVGSIAYLGFFFGNLPWIHDHFDVVIIAIILLSIAPMVTKVIWHKIVVPLLRGKDTNHD